MEQVTIREHVAPGRAPAVTRERAAVALLFLMNGYILGGWTPKIPEFAARLGLDSAGMGLMILVFGLGSLTLMPVAGALSARYGSGAVARGFGLGVGATDSLGDLVTARGLFGKKRPFVGNGIVGRRE